MNPLIVYERYKNESIISQGSLLFQEEIACPTDTQLVGNSFDKLENKARVVVIN